MRSRQAPPGRHDRPSRLPRRLAGTPPFVFVAWLCWLLVLVTYALLTPLYRAPDEPAHVQTTLLVRDGRYPAPGQAWMSSAVLGSVVESGLSPTGDVGDRAPLPLAAADAPPRDERHRFDELHAPGAPPQIDQQTQHPPLFYGMGAALLLALPGSGHYSFWHIVLALRLLDAVVMSPLPVLAWLAARRLVGAGPAAQAAAAVPIAIPMLAHLGGSVNNDALLIPLVGVVSVASVAVATGDLRRRTASLAGAAAALALLTKGTALITLPLLGLAYGAAALRRRALRPVLVPAALALGLAVAGGGWWYVRNEVSYGAVQPVSVRLPPAASGFSPDLGRWWTEFWQGMSVRFWGAFGWDNILIYYRLAFAASAVVLGLALLGAVGLRRQRLAVLVALAPLAGLLVLVAENTWRGYADTGVLAGIQGRYLFPAVTGLAAAVVAGLTVLARRAAPALPWLLTTAALGIELYGGRRLVGGFWQPPGGGLTDGLHTALVWAPLPPPVVVALVAATVLACGLLLAVSTVPLVAAVRRATAPGHHDRPAPDTVTGARPVTGRRASALPPPATHPSEHRAEDAAEHPAQGPAEDPAYRRR